jgi:hypothetical protein
VEENTQQRILDSCLLRFMDNYEGPERNIWITLEGTGEDFEPVREFKAFQIARGWMMKSPSGNLRLTGNGYLQHLPRAEYLRAKGDLLNFAAS